MDRLIGEMHDVEAFQMVLEDLPEAEAAAIIKGEKRDSDGRDLLQHAVLQAQVPVVKYLLEEHGTPINHTDAAGWNVLHLAASLGDPEMMALLLGGAPKSLIDGATESGQRPLHYAASKGHLQLVRLLLDAQANLRVANRFGQTPLHRAASLGRIGIVQCMVDHAMVTFGESEIRLKAWLDAKDGEGWTAVQMAAEAGTEDGRLVIQSLVDAGADPTTTPPADA